MNILEALEKSDKIKIVIDGRTLVYHDESIIHVKLIKRIDWEPVIEPLTFERIKRECAAGKTMFIDNDGCKEIYIGFSCRGLLITDSTDNEESFIAWREDEIKNWQISSKKWEG